MLTILIDCKNYNSHEKGTYPYAPCCQYEDTYLECTNRLNEFPNVKSATLHFDRHVADAEITLESILQHGVERRDAINQILRHFDGQLTDLAVRHYENGLHELRDCNEEEAEKNEESKEDVQLLWRNLDKLTSFRMSVTHVEVCADYGSNRRVHFPGPPPNSPVLLTFRSNAGHICFGTTFRIFFCNPCNRI
jgi:hypothetical protein